MNEKILFTINQLFFWTGVTQWTPNTGRTSGPLEEKNKQVQVFVLDEGFAKLIKVLKILLFNRPTYMYTMHRTKLARVPAMSQVMIMFIV